jgi:hypothetical protein
MLCRVSSKNSMNLGHYRGMPSCDEQSDAHAPVEPCELPDDIQLVYVDDRDRRRAIALEDAAGLDFGMAKAFRKPPAYRGQRNFPGWWWSATTRSHVLYESWLERHHVIEADRDACRRDSHHVVSPTL